MRNKKQKGLIYYAKVMRLAKGMTESTTAHCGKSESKGKNGRVAMKKYIMNSGGKDSMAT